MTDMCDGGAHIKRSHCSVMEAFLVECEPEEVDRNHQMTNSFFAIHKMNYKKTDGSMPHSFLDIEKCPDYMSGLYVRIIFP